MQNISYSIRDKSLICLILLLFSISTTQILARDFIYTFGNHTLTYTVLNEITKTCETKAGSFNANTTITAGNNARGNLIVPEIVSDGTNTYTVVQVGAGSFCGNTALELVKLPLTVKVIGDYAFSRCSWVSEIVLPDSLNTIGERAFSGCNKLKNIAVPFGVQTIGIGAFESCNSLMKFIIPNRVKTIKDYTFFNCNKLKEIVVPDSITSIGEYAFWKCIALTSVFIPNSVKSIYKYAFRDCTALESVTIGKSVNSSEYASLSEVFQGCSKLKQIISLNPIPPLANFKPGSSIPSGIVAYIPKHSLNNYSLKWGGFKDKIEIETIDFKLTPSSINLSVGETKIISTEIIKTTNIENFDKLGLWILKDGGDNVISADFEETSERKGEIAVTGKSPGFIPIGCYITDKKYNLSYWRYCYVTILENIAGVEEIPDSLDSKELGIKYFDMNGTLVQPDKLGPGIYIRYNKGKTEKIKVLHKH